MAKATPDREVQLTGPNGAQMSRCYEFIKEHELSLQRVRTISVPSGRQWPWPNGTPASVFCFKDPADATFFALWISSLNYGKII